MTVDVPLNDALVAKLRTAAQVDAIDRLALVQGKRTIAGAPPGVGKAPADRTADVTIGANEYRTFGVNLVDAPTNVSLFASTPRSAIDSGAPNRTLWTLLALTLTLVTVGALGYAAAPMLARRDRSLPMLGRPRDDHAVTLVGDALASTHNPDKLLPVILHATMEATGAARGRVLQDGRVTVEEGRSAGGRPLRLVLEDDESVGEIALEIWPASGSFDARTRTLAKSLAAQAAIALENARLHASCNGRRSPTSSRSSRTGGTSRRRSRPSFAVPSASASRSGSCSRTWTTSSASTTGTGTRSEIRCCARSPTACGNGCA